MMSCKCVSENREIWDPELFAHSLAKNYGLGWVDGAVAWEQFLSAMWGHIISKARGKGNLKEALQGNQPAQALCPVLSVS